MLLRVSLQAYAISCAIVKLKPHRSYHLDSYSYVGYVTTNGGTRT